MRSVTQIIQAAGLSGGMEFITDEALDRGRRIHEVIELDLAGFLDDATVPADLAPYLASFRGWRATVRLEPERMEAEVRGDGYVGHPDFVGRMNGARIVLDWKCGAPAAWHRLQTAAYAHAIGLHLRGAVYLRKDGKPARFERHPLASDFATFVSARDGDERVLDAWRAVYGPKKIETTA